MPVPPISLRNLRRRLSRQEIAEIVSRYQAGDGTPTLCRDFGLSKGGILQLLRSEGVLRSRQAITSTDAKQAAKLYDKGMTITEIVEQIGYSYSTIRNSLNQSGVAMRPKGIKRSALKKN